MDGLRQLEGVDRVELVRHSWNVDQASSECREPTDKSFHQSPCADQPDHIPHSASSADEVDPFCQSENADHAATPRQSQSADLAGEENAHDQMRNVDDEDSESLPTSSTDRAASADSSNVTTSLSSSMSVPQVCSIVGLAFVSVAAVLYILRRARHSKA